MKQTNSALKFLLAQYRAIFKHAQLASILAIAAAAGLSVGQANAATTDITTWADLKNNADQVTGELVIDGTDKCLTVTASDKGDAPLTDTIKVNITGGTNSIDGAAPAPQGDPDPKRHLVGEKVDITIAGADAKTTSLSIGGTNGNLGLKVNSVTVSKGALNVSADAATAETTLTANDLSFGSATEKDASATVAIKKLGTVSATKLTIDKGAEVSVAAEAKLIATNININEGKVTLGAAGSAPAPRPPAPSPFDVTTKATLGSDSSTVVIADGTVEAKDGVLLGQSISMTGGTISNTGTLSIGAKDKTFSATSGTVTNATGATSLTFESNASFDGGKLDVTAGTVTFNGTATFGKDSFKNAGSVVVMGETTIADDAIAADGDIGASGTLTIGYNGTSSTKLTLNAANLQALTAKADNKIIASGDGLTGDEKTFAEIHLTDTEGTLNLGNTQTDTNALKILADDTGALTANFESTDSKFKFSGKSAKFAGETIDNTAIFAFDTFTAGTKDAGLTVSGGASIAVTDNLTVGDGKGALLVKEGTVSLAGAAGAEAKALKAKSVTLGDAAGTAGKLEIASGKWSVTDLTLTSGSATVNGTAELTIKGNLTTSSDGTLVGNDAAIINAKEVGTLALGAQGVELKNTSVLILDAADVIADGAVIGNAFAKDAVTGSANSTIRILTGSELATFATAADYDTFRKATNFSGLFDVKITNLNAKNEMTFADGKDKVQGGVGSGYENTQVLVDGTTETVGDTYSVGNIKLTSGDTVKIDQAGSLTLENSNANGADSLFVSQTSGGKLVAGNVFFTNNVGGDSGLTLEGTGSIGSITTELASHGALTVGSAESKNGTVTVIGSIGTAETTAGASDEKPIASVTVNDGNNLHVQSGSITTDALKTGLNTTVDVGSGDITTDKATVSGNIKANVLTLNNVAQTHTFDGNAVVEVNKLVLGNSGKLEIGKDKVGDVEGSSAQIFTEVLKLDRHASIYVDPEYGQQASLLVVGSLSDSQSKPDVETLSGDAYIGKNSAIGIGFTKDGFNDVMADYLTVSGGFNEKGSVKNALVLNTPIKVESGKGIVLDSEASRTELNGKYQQNKIVMGAKTGIVLTDKAFGADKQSAAITFANAAGGFDAVASSDAVSGSQIVLVGDFDANDNELKIAMVQNGGSLKPATGMDKVTVTAAGGLLKGVYDAATGTYDMQFQNDKKGEIYAGISSPVGDLIVSKYQGEFSDKKALGYLFLSDVLSENNYKAVDAAAHAATYAGAQQAAVAAVGTMAEAVGGRVGTMGVEAASISATGTQANGGVWLTPMYKSVDADGFNAQGGSYGADVDLAGVAFGADTVNGNMRFGAVFNIGSGDADGKGNGNGLKDEFDYYGFGIYSVMGFGNLALVGDASLNVISHDVEAAGLGVNGSADTTAVTMGVTGQYTISNPMVDVVPHLGVRFTRLDTDSYDLSSAKGVIASTDFEVQNVVSIPLGVSISKAMEMGGWSLAPSADFSITFNTGDTEAESSTYFTGTRAISMTTEVLDEVTYGVAVGLGAQYGAFGTNIGINYTGSENTDSFGVNAQARYMF